MDKVSFVELNEEQLGQVEGGCWASLLGALRSFLDSWVTPQPAQSSVDRVLGAITGTVNTITNAVGSIFRLF